MQLSRVFSHALSIKRKLGLVIGLIMLVIALFASLSFSSLTQLEQAHYTFHDEITPRQSLLNELRNQLGYSGAIHNFKNYVLRGSETHRYAAKEQFAGAQRVIEKYQALTLTRPEKRALNSLQLVVATYQQKLEALSAYSFDSMSIEQRDQLVKVDDGPAIYAINALARTYEELAVEQDRLTEKQFVIAHWRIIFSSVVISLVTFSCLIWLYFIITSRLKHFAHYTQQVQSSLREEEEIPLNSLSWQGDELNDIATNFEHMLVMLQQEKMKAEQSNKAKGDFLAIVSHEIRTPMNGVLGTAQLLEKTPLSDAQHTHLRNLKESGQHMMTLLNEILDYSKIEHGKFELDCEPFALNHLTGAVSSIYRNVAQEKGIELYIDNQIPLERWVNADKSRIRQILFNLLSNAVKFTEKGFVELSLNEQFIGPNYLITIQVKDSGIGMEPSTLTRLFNPFEQADNSTTRRYGGTGLGLSIVYQLVQLMGGEVTVQSALNMGSLFKVTLSLDPAPPKEERERPLRHLALDGLSVLIVEDNQMNTLVIEAMMKQMGFITLCCENGQQAVELAKVQRFNLILMDNHMPIMDGGEAIVRIRKHGMNQESLILGCTADVYRETKQKLLQAGADGVIAKPVVEQECSDVFAEHASKLFAGKVRYLEAAQLASIESDQLNTPRMLEINGLGYDMLPLFLHSITTDIMRLVKGIHLSYQSEDMAALKSDAKTIQALFAKLGLSGMVALMEELYTQEVVADELITLFLEQSYHWLDELCLLAEQHEK